MAADVPDPLYLAGARVVIRDFEERDIDAWLAWRQPGHEWQHWDGPYFPPADPEILAERAEALREKIATCDWPSPRIYSAVAEPDSGALIGTVARYWISKETQWAAVGIVLFDPARWGAGIGTEALRLWCGYQFRVDASLPRLDLQSWSGNERVERLAARLGFRLEARFRNARIVDGERCDALGYGILREEWELLHGTG